MLLYILFFCRFGYADIMWSVVWSYCWLKSALLFLFSVHLLHDIGLLSDLVLLLLDYQFLLSGLSLIAIKHVFFTNNLSTHTAYYCPCINLLSSFFLRTHLILLLYALCLFVSLLSFVWINSSTTFAAILIVDFIFAWLLSWLLAICTNWSSLYLMFKYSAIFLIFPLYVLLQSVISLLSY